MVLDWPLIGRDAQLRRLVAAAEDSSGTGIAIVGESGVGKTRLAAELVRTLEVSDRSVAWALASESSGAIPYGALARLVTFSAGSADQPGLLAQLVRQLRDRGTESGPLVLVVDDAHMLDDHSAALVHLAVAERAAFVVLTARAGERLPSLLTRLWTDGLVERIEIGPLDNPQTRRLAEAVLEGPVESLTLTDLWGRSGGNPLFLRELILGGIESGAIRQDRGLWRSVKPTPPSARLSELVGERLGRLDRTQQDVIEMLALGGIVDLALLERVARDDVVEALEERRLIVVDRDESRAAARLAHPIYGEVLLADLPRSRIRRLMRTLADGIEATGARRREDVLRLALWRVEAGGTADHDLLLQAATDALATFDAPLAERLARAALNGGAGVLPRLLIGRALAAQQRVDEAGEMLATAAEHARSDAEISQVALARADLLYFRSGRAADATQVLVAARETVTDQDWRDELEALLVLFRAAAGQLRDVAQAGRRIRARPDARPRAIVHTLVYSSVANIMLGRFAEAEAEIELGLRHADAVQAEHPLGGQMLAINGMMASAYSGDLDRALTLGGDGLRVALAAGAPELVALWSMNVAEAQLVSGNPEEALATLLNALSAIRQADPFGVRGVVASAASLCASWLGRSELARTLLDEVVDNRLAIDVRSRIWLDRAAVWASLPEAGSRAAATRGVEAAGRAIGETHLVWAAWILHDVVRLGHPDLAAARLDKLADRIEGRMVDTMAMHARALLDEDPVGLERVASAFEQIGSLLYAAESAAQAQQAYLRKGRQRLARIAGARAALLAARCPGASTPALADAAPVPLTPRELQIARMAADGLTSRELADRLKISIRTVDNHLGTIYGKLGVGGRAELPEVMGVVSR